MLKHLNLKLLSVALSLLSQPQQLAAQGYSPEESVRQMTAADGFTVELVAAEPLVRQPVAIDFDDRGRLWVLQYLQYPNPAGLERVAVDRFSRTTYDRVPLPPPRGPKGADRLTILTDTDDDGRMDTAQDFVSDLNLATGFEFGFGGVFVLQTPYLLFYPDRNHDDLPDGDPEVLLTGFGMEDTSSLANSLVWGPDGWLYGTHGTNISASIRGIQFEQGVWRYHPLTRRFELFMEGGSNMWGLDFDRRGNLAAGTNYGGFLMFHCIDGAYYQKSFAKHGELNNPFAFGYFDHAAHRNFQGGHVTVGGIFYQGHAFPEQFRDKYIAVDTLGHAVRWHHVHPEQSTFRTENGGVLLQANDAWFAPSDCVMGPDEAIYIADWHDQRTAHPDPDAEWDRSNGRVFRLRWNESQPAPVPDPHSLASTQLTTWLDSNNDWQRRRARRILMERQYRDDNGLLRQKLTSSPDPQQTLQTLWTLAASNGITENSLRSLLEHTDASVRAWAIRLLCELDSPSADSLKALVHTAAAESNPLVISQLAAGAQRLPSESGLLICRIIAGRTEFSQDPRIPLQIWWALERIAIPASELILEQFADSTAWQTPVIREQIMGRLMRRFAADGSSQGFSAAAQLLATAPDFAQRQHLLHEMDSGLKMIGQQRSTRLPLPDNSLAIRQIDIPHAASPPSTVPAELAVVLQQLWSDSTTDPLLIRLALRMGSRPALQRAVTLTRSSETDTSLRLQMLAVLFELGDTDSCTPLAQELSQPSQPESIRAAALKLMGRFADSRSTSLLVINYPQLSSELQTAARNVLFARPDSAMAFLQAVENGHISPATVPVDQLRLVALHNNAQISTLVQKHWGSIQAGTPEQKLAEIRRITNDLNAGAGNAAAGRQLFEKHCANCHQLFSVGREIGPDLTRANRNDRSFLLVSMVDPSAQIRREYLSYVAVTTDGRIVNGLLINESAASVTILQANNERIVIPRSELEELNASAVSMMPENILRGLQPQQLRDLVQFLQSDGK